VYIYRNINIFCLIKHCLKIYSITARSTVGNELFVFEFNIFVYYFDYSYPKKKSHVNALEFSQFILTITILYLNVRMCSLLQNVGKVRCLRRSYINNLIAKHIDREKFVDMVMQIKETQWKATGN